MFMFSLLIILQFSEIMQKISTFIYDFLSIYDF